MKLKSSFSEKDELELFNYFSTSLKNGKVSTLESSAILEISNNYLRTHKKIDFYKRVEIGLTDIEFELHEEKSERKKLEYFLAFQQFIKNIREEKSTDPEVHLVEVTEPLPLEAFRYLAHNKLLDVTTSIKGHALLFD